MYERDLTNEGNNDTIVTLPLPATRQNEGAARCRSRVTQYGNTSLEIEIPREGLTCSSGFGLWLFLLLPFTLVLVGIPFVLRQTLLYGPTGVYWFLVTCLLMPILFAFLLRKSSDFTRTNVKIMRDSYSLIRKNITWKSYLHITCLPDHFDDLENWESIETIVEDSQHPRTPFLQAEVVTIEDGDGVFEQLKLGSITFPHGLPNDELEWLAQEMNRFIQETL